MAKRLVKEVLRLGGVELTRFDKSKKPYQVAYKKYQSYTMVPEGAFILNLDLCNRFKNVKGDFVECGVWRGGMSAAIAEALGHDRQIHLFDSFQGLPAAKDIDGREALAWQSDITSPGYFENCKAEESYVVQAMKLAGHKKYQTYPGWFNETLPQFGAHSIAILRLDGDWYDSIIVCLDHLFPKVVEGGVVLLDDYYTWDGCAKAVHDYLAKTKSPSRVYQWNNQIAYLIKKN